jgi:eukaryotic-like serine/threonine-protein kinase
MTRPNRPSLTPPSRYKKLALLGRGGMADVYLTQLGGTGFSKLAVLKRVRERLENDDELTQMFMDEGRLAARLNHPNIVQTFEVGTDAQGPFLAMEFLDGQTLSRLSKVASKQEKPLPLPLALSIVQQALSALHYAHELEDYDGKKFALVHRDVSPQNIFVMYSGVAKLMDFGVAKSEQALAETRTGVLKGKVVYMAPEQARGDLSLDRRADVFAMGIVMWELITHRRFWEGFTEVQIFGFLHGQEPFASPAPFSAAPKPLLDVCEKAIHRDRALRYQTAEEFLSALEAAVAESGMRSTQTELTSFINSLFAEDRKKLRAAIEQRTSEVEAQDSGDVDPLFPSSPRSGTGSGSSERFLSSLPESTPHRTGASGARPAGTLVSASAEASFAQAPASGIPKNAVIAAIAAVSIVGILGFVFTRPKDAPALPIAQQEVLSRSEPVPMNTQVVVRKSYVQVNLSATPASAKLVLDGEVLPSNPYINSRPIDDQTHVLVAQAANHQSQTTRVSFSNDVQVQLALIWNGAPAPGILNGGAKGNVAVGGGVKAVEPTSTGGPSAAATTRGITEIGTKPQATAAPKTSIDTDIFKK